MDKEFAARIGDGLEEGVDRILAEANELLGEVGLNLRAGSTQRWRSDDAAAAMADLLDSADAQALRLPGRAMLAITAQHSGRYDGWFQGAAGSAIARYYDVDRGRIFTLIAHEVAHLIGARHHEAEAECDGDGCIMDRRGFDHARTWCHHHEQQIKDIIYSTLDPAAA
jgi:hypothetical protein